MRHVMHDAAMTQPEVEHVAVPPWTLDWRLQRALSWGNVSVQEMADELGVSRGTISRWCNGHNRPRTSDLKVWALRCGVPFDWLLRGECAIQDSNLEPTGDSVEPLNPPGTREIAQFRKKLGHTGLTRTPIRTR